MADISSSEVSDIVYFCCRRPGFVAVKTMRGMSDNETHYWASVSEPHTSVLFSGLYGMYVHKSWLAQLAIGIVCHYCHHVDLLSCPILSPSSNKYVQQWDHAWTTLTGITWYVWHCCAHSRPFLNSWSPSTYTSTCWGAYTIESKIHTVATEPQNNWIAWRGWTIHIAFCYSALSILCEVMSFTFLNANLFAFIHQQWQAFSASARWRIWASVTRSTSSFCG